MVGADARYPQGVSREQVIELHHCIHDCRDVFRKIDACRQHEDPELAYSYQQLDDILERVPSVDSAEMLFYYDIMQFSIDCALCDGAIDDGELKVLNILLNTKMNRAFVMKVFDDNRLQLPNPRPADYVDSLMTSFVLNIFSQRPEFEINYYDFRNLFDQIALAVSCAEGCPSPEQKAFMDGFRAGFDQLADIHLFFRCNTVFLNPRMAWQDAVSLLGISDEEYDDDVLEHEYKRILLALDERKKEWGFEKCHTYNKIASYAYHSLVEDEWTSDDVSTHETSVFDEASVQYELLQDARANKELYPEPLVWDAFERYMQQALEEVFPGSTLRDGVLMPSDRTPITTSPGPDAAPLSEDFESKQPDGDIKGLRRLFGRRKEA